MKTALYGRIVFGASAILFGVIALKWHDAQTWQELHGILRLPFGSIIGGSLMVAQIAGGIGLMYPRTVRSASIVLGVVYALFSLACIPGIITKPTVFDQYDGFFEQFCLLCGAIAVYAATDPSAARSAALGRVARIGLGLCVISFTLAQLIYLRMTADLVPKWIPPNQMFWAVLTTIAFALAAVAILINFKARLAIRLMSLMIALFGILVWVPLLIAHPTAHLVWSEFALNFLIAGAAWMVAMIPGPSNKRPSSQRAVTARSSFIAAFLAAIATFMLPDRCVAADSFSAASIQGVVRNFMTVNHQRAVIVQVRSNASDVYTGAFGDSMTGVPATTDMHFRNGAMAFTYMATLLLEFVDKKKVTLETKLSAFFPDLPRANQITLKDLAQMTSGYADYVYQNEFQDAFYRDPFRQWTPEELIRIGVSGPEQFAPGTNWGYSHTNYVILGRVLEKIAGMPLADALRQYVLEGIGLTQTTASTTPAIPQPVLHAFTSERREILAIKPDIPFYEEATYWNPSWTTVEGAVQTTDITDLSVSIEAVSSGKLLSPESAKAQISPTLIGFGHTQAGCPACRQGSTQLSYGLGVLLSGPWVTQTLGFAGASGAVGYLPAQKLTIAVEATNGPGAYDAKGNAGLGAVDLFRDLADVLAPNTLPPAKK